MQRVIFVRFLLYSSVFLIFFTQSCRVYEDNAFFTFTGQIVNQEDEAVSDFIIGFGELSEVSGLVFGENGLPERRFVRVIYRVRTESDGSFRIVIPQKNTARYYLVSYGGAKFQVSNFSGDFESDVSEANYFLSETDRVSTDLGRIKMIIP